MQNYVRNSLPLRDLNAPAIMVDRWYADFTNLQKIEPGSLLMQRDWYDYASTQQLLRTRPELLKTEYAEQLESFRGSKLSLRMTDELAKVLPGMVNNLAQQILNFHRRDKHGDGVANSIIDHLDKCELLMGIAEYSTFYEDGATAAIEMRVWRLLNSRLCDKLKIDAAEHIVALGHTVNPELEDEDLGLTVTLLLDDLEMLHEEQLLNLRANAAEYSSQQTLMEEADAKAADAKEAYQVMDKFELVFNHALKNAKTLMDNYHMKSLERAIRDRNVPTITRLWKQWFGLQISSSTQYDHYLTLTVNAKLRLTLKLDLTPGRDIGFYVVTQELPATSTRSRDCQVLAELVRQFDQAGFGERLAKAEELVAKLRHYLS